MHDGEGARMRHRRRGAHAAAAPIGATAEAEVNWAGAWLVVGPYLRLRTTAVPAG